MQKKAIRHIFFGLTTLSLLTPLWVFGQLLFPYITSKAFFFRILVEAALPFYFYLILVDKNLRPKLNNPLNALVLIFLLINIITSLTGANIEKSFWGNFERMGGTWYSAHLTALFFYIQAVGKSEPGYLKKIFQVFIGVSVLLSLNGLLAKIGGPTLTLDPSAPARISSTFGNPIFFASFLIIPTFLAGYLALQENSKILKFAYWAAVFFQLLGIYFSGTRGAVVGLLVAVFFSVLLYVLLSKNSKLRNYGFGVLGVLIFLVIGLYSLRNNLPENSTLFRVVNLYDSNSQARLIQWEMAFKGFKKYPISGVGPENYYVIFNEFYNPELYKYDASWFDKPHNYWLEVLNTNGIFGFLSYVAIFLLAGFGLYKGFKTGILGLLETCVLIAGLMAYQVQNLFVFDTVSASMAWFLFLGFAAFIWQDSETEKKSQTPKILAPVWAGYALIVAIFIACYLEYASNIASLQASKRVNFGQAYSAVDPKKAAEYFNGAFLLPFNFDIREASNFYSRFISNLVTDPKFREDKNFIEEQFEQVISRQRAVAEKIKNDPILWSNLAVAQMNSALFRGESVEVAKDALAKSLKLAPLRVEILQIESQYYGYQKDWVNVVKTAEKITSLNPNSSGLKWQLAMSYYLAGSVDKAIEAGDRAIAEGFEFQNLQQFAWYIQYYQEQKNWLKVAVLLERAIVLEPKEIGLYLDLVKTYIYLGDDQRAKLLVEQIIASNPSQRAEVEAFIKSLK